MAFSDRPYGTCWSFDEGSNSLSQFHSGQHDLHNGHADTNQRNDCHRTERRGLLELVGLQHDSKWASWGFVHHLFGDDSRGRVPAGNCRPDCGSNRDGNHHQDHRSNLYAKLAVNLLPVIFFFPVGIKAQEVNATANPVATSSGSVSNQAVQINQGGFSKQSFSPGHSCNSSTLTITPFFLGNESNPDYIRNQNYGLQATISFPLDGKMVELCKSLAEKRLQKERLDYALIRALKCAELLKKGFMFHPDSQYSVVCADVVPIARAPKKSSPDLVISDKQ